MMSERGLTVDHTTVWRWMQRYGPEINKRIRPHLKLAGASYRVDETYIKVGMQCKYLYRAVDKEGNTIRLKIFLATLPTIFLWTHNWRVCVYINLNWEVYSYPIHNILKSWNIFCDKGVIDFEDHIPSPAQSWPLASVAAVQSVVEQLRSALPHIIPKRYKDLVRMLCSVRYINRYPATDT
jgi:hypothetical protein